MKYTATQDGYVWNLEHKDFPLLNETNLHLSPEGFYINGTYILLEDVEMPKGKSIEEHMVDPEADNEYAAWAIEEEGLEYATTALRSYYDFVDPKTRKLWKAAAEANQALIDYLEEYDV